MKNSNPSVEFGIDEDDDIIEESPIKAIPKNDKLRDFAKVLREKYLLNSSMNIENNSKDKPNLLRTANPLSPSNLNINLTSASTPNKKLPSSHLNHHQENVISPDEAKENIIQINERESCQVETAKIQVNIEKKQSISLQRFAFRG